MKTYLVPITRENGPRETYSSDTPVLVLPSKTDTILRVQEVRPRLKSQVEFAAYHQVWSWEAPPQPRGKKRPGSYYERVLVKAPLNKLGRLFSGTPFIMKVDPKRPQRVFYQGGRWHSLFTESDIGETTYATAVCGESHHGREVLRENGRVPDCPECLAEEWLPFHVAPYEMPTKIRKIAEKEAAERKFRASIPTRFERVGAEEEEPKEVEVIFIPPEDLEPDDEPLGREEKLLSRVRQARFLKERV